MPKRRTLIAANISWFTVVDRWNRRIFKTENSFRQKKNPAQNSRKKLQNNAPCSQTLQHDLSHKITFLAKYSTL